VSTSILQAYRRPQDPPPINGALLRKQDAQSVANELGAMWGTSQRAYEVTTPAEVAFNIELGDYVNIIFPISDLAGGQLGQIIGERFTSDDNEVVFTLVGLRSRRVPRPGQVRNLAFIRATDTQIDVSWEPLNLPEVRYQVLYRLVN
jgi:hypothetical protein